MEVLLWWELLTERMKMERIEHYRNNCTLVALKEISGKSDAEILAAVRRNNYKNNQGMYQDDYLRAGRELGMIFGENKYCTTLFVDQFEGNVSIKYNIPRITLSAILKKLGKGTFLVRTPRHVLVVRDGKMVDKNFYRPKLGRSAIDYTEVKNAYQAPKLGVLKVARENSRKRGTRPWIIAEKVFNYIKANPKATAAEVLKVSPGYSQSWLNWDLKRGNIVEI